MYLAECDLNIIVRVINNIGEAHIKRNDGRKMMVLSMVVKRRNDGVRSGMISQKMKL